MIVWKANVVAERLIITTEQFVVDRRPANISIFCCGFCCRWCVVMATQAALSLVPEDDVTVVADATAPVRTVGEWHALARTAAAHHLHHTSVSNYFSGLSVRRPYVVRLVVISRKLSKTDSQLLWNTIRKLASLILLPHFDPLPDTAARIYSAFKYNISAKINKVSCV